MPLTCSVTLTLTLAAVAQSPLTLAVKEPSVDAATVTESYVVVQPVVTTT